METKTKKRILGVAVVGFLLFDGAVGVFAGGSKEVLFDAASGEGTCILLEIEEGPEYLHKLKVLPLIRVNSPPQLAVWTEDERGRFLETLYVTSRVATGEWRSAPRDKTPSGEITRPEALPVWSQRSDGADVRSGATPREGYAVRGSLEATDEPVRLLVEVNHSTDFNATYPADALPGSRGYSGGAWGSGQPSLIYDATVDPSRPGETVELRLLGHGSPDGSSGEIDTDLSGVTSAREILESVKVRITS